MSLLNTDLINYVLSLDESKNDKKEAVEQFIGKLNEKINYQETLDEFEWTEKGFEKIDRLLVELGYRGQDETIALIKEFLRNKLKDLPIMTYNKLFGANIWNHFQLLANNPHYINWTHLSSNPAAIDLLEANQDKIDWKWLSENPAAIALLKANPHNIDWQYIYQVIQVQ